MKRKYKIGVAALAAVAILITAVATTAFAASRVNTPLATPTDADYQAWGCPVANGNYEAIANLLGMTSQELDAQLQQGKSLLEIASSKGVNEDKLVATIIAPMKEFMQQQGTSGAWTQAQLDSRLKLADQHIRQLVNAKGNSAGYGSGGCGGAGGMMSGGGTNSNGSFERGGMMGGNYGGMMGGYGGRTGGGFGGMMGGWY
ncbi:MAG: hypothetical protein Q7R57_08965 [Dehalococcoidales bacterium]|nr:hypothetical protein [Dehalococcoidales bacterium]